MELFTANFKMIFYKKKLKIARMALKKGFASFITIFLQNKIVHISTKKVTIPTIFYKFVKKYSQMRKNMLK